MAGFFDYFFLQSPTQPTPNAYVQIIDGAGEDLSVKITFDDGSIYEGVVTSERQPGGSEYEYEDG